MATKKLSWYLFEVSLHGQNQRGKRKTKKTKNKNTVNSLGRKKKHYLVCLSESRHDCWSSLRFEVTKRVLEEYQKGGHLLCTDDDLSSSERNTQQQKKVLEGNEKAGHSLSTTNNYCTYPPPDCSSFFFATASFWRIEQSNFHQPFVVQQRSRHRTGIRGEQNRTEYSHSEPYHIFDTFLEIVVHSSSNTPKADARERNKKSCRTLSRPIISIDNFRKICEEKIRLHIPLDNND